MIQTRNKRSRKAASRHLEKQIQHIKQEMVQLGPMRPGSLTKQKRQGGTGPYGQYWHLSYTLQGRGHTEYVPPASVDTIRGEIRNYWRFRNLVERLIRWSIKRSQRNVKRTRKDSVEA